MNLRHFLIASTVCLAACKDTTTTTQNLTGGDYIITNEQPWENSMVVTGPGENSHALLGQIVLSGGQNANSIYTKPLFGSGSPAKPDTAANAVVRILPVSATEAFGTDNGIVKLKDGSLLAMRNAESWGPMNNPPVWGNDSIEGAGIHKGQRGASSFWRSTDAGITWTKQGMIDFGDEALRKFGAPRPMNNIGKADVPIGEQATMPNGRKRWWIGGGDRPEIYVCPFTNRIWHTTRIISGILGSTQLDAYLLFLSVDQGKTWKLIKDNIPGCEALVMTSTPDGRLFLFQTCDGSTASIQFSLTEGSTNGNIEFSQPYPVSRQITVNGKTTDILARGPDTVHFDRLGVGTPSICRVTVLPGYSTNAVLVAYQARNKWGNQEYEILDVQVKDENTAPLVIPITTIKAEDPSKQSVMHGAFIEPELQLVPSGSASARSLFYWVQAPRKPGGNFAVRYCLFTAGAYMAPQFLSTKHDGSARYFNSVPGIGDYMKGAFFWYDNKFNFAPQWAEADGIHCKIISASPK